MARPQYKPTAAIRDKVAVCAGGGMAHEEIAMALGISRPTLYKHFEHELSVGAYEKRAQVIKAMHKAALKGNVAAQKAFVALPPSLAAPPLPKPDKPAKEEPLGKKEQQQADAVVAQVGTEWAELLPHPQAMQ